MEACTIDEEGGEQTQIDMHELQRTDTKDILRVTTDEEGQQQHNFIVVLDRLQKELCKLRIENEHTKTETQSTREKLLQELETSTANNELVQNEMRNLQGRLHVLEEAKIRMQVDIQQLKAEQNHHNQQEQASTSSSPQNQAANASASSSSSLPQRSPIAMPSIFQRNLISDDGLPQDTFTLMMTSGVTSRAWALGIITFTIQMTLIIMIGINQIKDSSQSSLFNVPFKVDGVVRTGQLLTIIFTLATQNDIISSVRFLVMFWRDPRWDRAVLRRHEGAPPPTNTLRIVHILLPNGLKLLQGFLVICTTFVVIVQSDNIIDLLKDFTALMVMSETDNIFFWLAVNGYLGSKLQRKTIEARDIDIQDEVMTAYTNLNRGSSLFRSRSLSNGGFVTRSMILISIGIAMIGGWLYIVFNQVNGTYFYRKFPNCNPPDDQPDIDMFLLAKNHFGNEICYGGPLNTLGCEFEGGDCINFNLAFPLCKGTNRTDVQRVGDGECEETFMHADCDFDGGDCCPYKVINDPLFGDGKCDRDLNTRGCGYDKGDCLEYNRDFPGCPYDIVFNNPLFGNGQCNGGISSTKSCGFDNRDCDEFHHSFPDCPLDELLQIKGSDEVVLGDGICDSGIYNSGECGYELGDCNYGQIGQDVHSHDQFELLYEKDVYFNKELSLDGTTVAIGLPYNDEAGNFDNNNASGLVKVLRYDNTGKKWSQIGSNIAGSSNSFSHFGRNLCLSSDGNRIAIQSSSGMQILEFDATSDDWSQVGQTITTSSQIAINGLSMMVDGSRVAYIHAEGEIRRIHIYDLESSSNNQTWVNDDHNVINLGGGIGEANTRLEFNALDGSRILCSTRHSIKVFQFDPNTPSHKLWIQMGQNIEHSSHYFGSSTSISADGNRFAVTLISTSNFDQEVIVFEYNGAYDQWARIGDPIKSSLSRLLFGYSINLSSDGNLLAIGSNKSNCQNYQNQFNIDECTTGSIELFYDDGTLPHRFQRVPSKPSSPYKITSPFSGNVLNLASLARSDHRIISGLHLSLSGDGSVLSISGYDVDDQSMFVQFYNLDNLFYTKCAVKNAYWIGNRFCNDSPPYNSEACGFDGGDCDRKPVEGYLNCFVHDQQLIGNGNCDYNPPYNTEGCGFDGGDCIAEGYLKCIVEEPHLIGDGSCQDWPPYNKEECGFDGGDCVPSPVEGYPNCFVHHTYAIGNGRCDEEYNTEECGFDGGDCVLKPVEGYPGCFIFQANHDWIGDRQCDDRTPYNTVECGFDGGDCL